MFGEHKLTVGLNDLKALFQPKGFSDFQGSLSLVEDCLKMSQPSPPGCFPCTLEVFPPPRRESSPTDLTDSLSQGKAERAPSKPSILLPVVSPPLRRLGASRAPSKVSQHHNFPFLQSLLPLLNPGKVLGKAAQHLGRVFGKSSRRRVNFLGVEDVLISPLPL